MNSMERENLIDTNRRWLSEKMDPISPSVIESQIPNNPLTRSLK
jgi:hypothetical protein